MQHALSCPISDAVKAAGSRGRFGIGRHSFPHEGTRHLAARLTFPGPYLACGEQVLRACVAASDLPN